MVPYPFPFDFGTLIVSLAIAAAVVVVFRQLARAYRDGPNPPKAGGPRTEVLDLRGVTRDRDSSRLIAPAR